MCGTQREKTHLLLLGGARFLLGSRGQSCSHGPPRRRRRRPGHGLSQRDGELLPLRHLGRHPRQSPPRRGKRGKDLGEATLFSLSKENRARTRAREAAAGVTQRQLRQGTTSTARLDVQPRQRTPRLVRWRATLWGTRSGAGDGEFFGGLLLLFQIYRQAPCAEILKYPSYSYTFSLPPALSLLP